MDRNYLRQSSPENVEWSLRGSDQLPCLRLLCLAQAVSRKHGQNGKLQHVTFSSKMPVFQKLLFWITSALLSYSPSSHPLGKKKKREKIISPRELVVGIFSEKQCQPEKDDFWVAGFAE